MCIVRLILMRSSLFSQHQYMLLHKLVLIIWRYYQPWNFVNMIHKKWDSIIVLMYYIYFYMQMSTPFHMFIDCLLFLLTTPFSDLYVWPTWIQKSDAYKHSFFCFADVLEKHTREIMRAEKGANSSYYDNLYRSMKSISWFTEVDLSDFW